MKIKLSGLRKSGKVMIKVGKYLADELEITATKVETKTNKDTCKSVMDTNIWESH
jgi:hypothetical protein